DAAARVPAIHLNMMGLRPYLGEGSPPLTAEEEEWVAHAGPARTRDRLSGHPGHETPDAGLRAHRLPGRAGRVDRREVPRLEPAGPRRAAVHDGADHHQRHDLLAHGVGQHRELALHRSAAARRHAAWTRRAGLDADRLPLLPARPVPP